MWLKMFGMTVLTAVVVAVSPLSTVQAQVAAGDLLVDLDASSLPMGVVSSWANGGTLGGVFTNEGGGGPTEVRKIGGAKAVWFPNWRSFKGPKSTAAIEGASDRSIEVWAFQPNPIWGEETLVSWGARGGPAGTNMGFGFGSHHKWGACGHWGAPDIGWNGTPPANKWVHLAYTYDGTTVRLYQDGVLKNSKNASLNTKINKWIRIGRQGNNNGSFNNAGRLDRCAIAQVRIHDGVLSPADIAYNASLRFDAYAYNPKPANGGFSKVYTELSWTPGGFATSSDLYFGDDAVAVAAGDASTFLGNYTYNNVVVGAPGSVVPDLLELGKTYYWRVDAINPADSNSPWIGDVWSFTVKPDSEIPVPPTIHAWYDNLTETSVDLVIQLIDDGNELCRGTFDYSCPYDTVPSSTPSEAAIGDDYFYIHKLTGLVPDMEYQYTATVDNLMGSVSLEGSFRTLGTRPAYMIYKQPQGQRVNVGGTAELSFTVIAEGVDETMMQYQWSKAGPGQPSTPIPGATQPTLVLENVTEADHGNYSCFVIMPGVGVAITEDAMVSVNQLMAFWKMDGDLTDASGKGWDATLEGPEEDAFATSHFGQAFNPSRYVGRRAIAYGTEEAFNFYKNGFTIAGWVKTSYYKWICIAGKEVRGGGATWNGWVFNISPQGQVELGLRQTIGYKAGGPVNDGVWHFVAATYTPETGQVQIFVDGRHVGSGFSKKKIVTNSEPVTIGAEDAAGIFSPFQGMIDELRIYNHPLPGSEIRTLFVGDRYPELVE